MKKEKDKPGCVFVRSNLFSYQEKQLSDQENKEFEDHLRSCGDCTGIVSEFLSVASFIEQKKSDEPNPFIGTRILQRIESHLEEARAKPVSFFNRILRPVSLSSLILIAIIIGFSIVKQMNTRSSNNINHQNDIQAMKSDLNISDFIDDDKTFFDNH